jgi:Domain of unknown function (DUF5666)
MLRRMLKTRTHLVGVAVVGALLATASVAAAASPVTGSVAGPITEVKGQMFKLTTTLSPTGASTIHLGSKTAITQQVAGTRANLQKGVCVTAVGQKNGKGVVAATQVTVTKSVNGKCTGGFGQRSRPGGSRPPGSTPPTRPPGGGAGGFANFGFANGAISAIKGSTLTVHGQRGTTTVTVSAKTKVSKRITVGSSAIRVKQCAFVNGTSTDKGVNVSAQTVSISDPGPTGCSSGFRRP